MQSLLPAPALSNADHGAGGSSGRRQVPSVFPLPGPLPTAEQGPPGAFPPLPPLPVAIYRGNELVRCVDVPDPRDRFIRQFNGQYLCDGLRAALPAEPGPELQAEEPTPFGVWLIDTTGVDEPECVYEAPSREVAEAWIRAWNNGRPLTFKPVAMPADWEPVEADRCETARLSSGEGGAT